MPIQVPRAWAFFMEFEQIADERMKEIRRLRVIIRNQPDPLECITAVFNLLNWCPSDLVDQVWPDDAHLNPHLNQKLRGLCRREDCLNGNVIARFWAELDEQNRAKLTNWVLLNYKSYLR